MTKRLLTFDLMRLIAIFIILFHHLTDYSFNFYNLQYFGIDLDLSPWHELNPHLGLGMFLFLSGYLLNRKNIKFSGFNESKNFLINKLLRIFPLYYLALILFFYIDKPDSLIEIALHTVALQLIFVSHFPILKTLWFVGLIMVYYLAFALVKNINLNLSYKIAIVVIFPFVVLFLGRYYKLTDSRLAHYYWVFFFGTLCAETNFFQQKIWQKIKFVIPLFFVSTFIFMYHLEDTFGLYKINLLQRHLLITVLSISFSLFVYQICDALAKSIKSRKMSEAIELVAYSSYCMFLFHRPVWYFLGKIHKEILDLDNPYINLGIATIIGIPLIVGISFRLQSLHDKYFVGLFRKTA